MVVMCSATAKSSGERCRRAALKGGSVCWVHGGAASQVQRAAAVRVAESEAMAAFERYRGPDGDGAPPDVVAELTHLVSVVTSFQAFAEARLQALSSADWAAHSPRVAAQLGMFERSCDRARRLLRDVVELGVLERVLAVQARISESQGAALAATIRRIVTDLGHNPNDPDVREIVYMRLGELVEEMDAAADG
jgi:hypothetical protein